MFLDHKSICPQISFSSSSRENYMINTVLVFGILACVCAAPVNKAALASIALASLPSTTAFLPSPAFTTLSKPGASSIALKAKKDEEDEEIFEGEDIYGPNVDEAFQAAFDAILNLTPEMFAAIKDEEDAEMFEEDDEDLDEEFHKDLDEYFNNGKDFQASLDDLLTLNPGMLAEMDDEDVDGESWLSAQCEAFKKINEAEVEREIKRDRGEEGKEGRVLDGPMMELIDSFYEANTNRIRMSELKFLELVRGYIVKNVERHPDIEGGDLLEVGSEELRARVLSYFFMNVGKAYRGEI
jgi:hypothetical protein